MSDCLTLGNVTALKRVDGTLPMPKNALNSSFLCQSSTALGLAMLAAVLTAATASAAVFGPDDRTRVETADAPAAANIGQLRLSHSGALCSAFCVASDLIVTASHCITGGPSIAASPLGKLHFSLGKLRSQSTGIRGSQTATQALNITIGTRQLKLTPPINASEDWALMRLAAPICPMQSLPLGRHEPAEVEAAIAQGQVYQLAFHGDTKERALQRSGDCSTEQSAGTGTASLNAAIFARDFSNTAAILFHGCDTGGGSSGSPLLLDGPRGPEVVGLNVGTYVVTRTAPGAPSGAVQPSAASAPTEAIANTAIDVGQFRAAVADLAARDILTDPSEMRTLSRRLRRLGLYKGRVSGRFSAALEAAIRRYEVSRGQSVTGQPTRALLLAVKAAP